jgi:hypothetical protein
MERAELEGALTRLSQEVAFPPTPALVTGVRTGIAAGAPRRGFMPDKLFGGRQSWQTAVAALVLVIAVFGAVMVFSPAARHAVADFFGVEGIDIEVKATPLPTDVPALGTALDLGERTTLADAEEAAGFDIQLPADLGTPDEVYRDQFGLQMTSLVYVASDELPESSTTGVGLLISQFEGRIARGDLLGKIVHQGARLDPIEVNGQPGYWIDGEPHILYFIDPSGIILDDTVRLAGNTLMWESGGVTIRMESELSKAEALRIARSMR